MDVEIRVELVVVVKPWSAMFDRGLALELVGEVNIGLWGDVANALVFERVLVVELVGVDVIE